MENQYLAYNDIIDIYILYVKYVFDRHRKLIVFKSLRDKGVPRWYAISALFNSKLRHNFELIDEEPFIDSSEYPYKVIGKGYCFRRCQK